MRTESSVASLSLDLKRWFALVMLGAVLLVIRPGEGVLSLRGSEQALRGANRELARILLAMNHLGGTDLKVIFDGDEYPLATARLYAQKYLRLHYRGESAEVWIKKYLYRSPTAGKEIYLKYPDGFKKLLRDVFLQKLPKS